ncbi:hypothetical protein B0H14DRAFT_3886697 [Mycena olivaceomarginata]|nr:hypothetical protein B0H14DRAFT_3886697 [Mycena olivaceomarginata]
MLPGLVISSLAGLALAPPPTQITAAPIELACAVTAAPAPAISFTTTCWCETIPYLTTTFCLPCSTVFFTTDITTFPTTSDIGKTLLPSGTGPTTPVLTGTATATTAA